MLDPNESSSPMASTNKLGKFGTVNFQVQVWRLLLSTKALFNMLL